MYWPDCPETPFDFDEIDFQRILASAAEIVRLLQSAVKHDGEKWDGTSPTGTFAERLLTTATQEAEALRAILFEAHLVAPEFEVTAADGFRRVSGRDQSGTTPRAKRMRLQTARPALAVQSAVLLAEAVCRFFNQGHDPSFYGGMATLARDSLARLDTAIEAVRHWFPPSPESDAGAGQQSEGTGRIGRANARSKLKPCQEKALAQYTKAIQQNAELSGAIDRVVYDWIKEHLLDNGEQLPTFATWGVHLRAGRQAHGLQKNSKRAGRSGRSVANSGDI